MARNRSSNIELCRIIIMLMIILHHAVLHGGGVGMEYCTNKLIAFFFLPGGKIAFDTFIVISMWFFVDQEFRADRLIKVYLIAIFFSILMMAASCLYSHGGGIRPIDIISGLLPVSGKMHGFIQTYIAFYLLFPFISKTSKGMTKEQNLYIILVFSLFVFSFQILASLTWSGQSVYCRLILFIFFFYLIRYIKYYCPHFATNLKLNIILFLTAMCLDEAITYLNLFAPTLYILKYQGLVLGDESRILNVLAGTSLFFIFYNLKMPTSKVINWLGSTTLAVLMIHDSDFFRIYTWDIFKTTEWFYSKYYLILLIFSSIVIYLFCSMVDFIRRILFNKFILSSKIIINFEKKLETIFPKDKGSCTKSVG